MKSAAKKNKLRKTDNLGSNGMVFGWSKHLIFTVLALSLEIREQEEVK